MGKLNRYYTILVVPEKTAQVKKFVIPSWVIKGVSIAIAGIGIISMVMLLDYWFVMTQIHESKQLKQENRRFRQQLEVVKSKLSTIENTLDRVKTFTTRLKVITNVEDKSGLLESLNRQLPDAAINIDDNASSANQVQVSLNTLSDQQSQDATTLGESEYNFIDVKIADLSGQASFMEQVVQDQYELLADQKAFLAALPTRKPAPGYFTSGFGIRRSPYGGSVKMHEGIDIANQPGTHIYATANGIVSFSSSKPGYGQILIIDHGYGIETWYAHVKKILVSKGQHVKRGDTVALLGSSGRSTGPHLHYEVRVRGTPFDPRSYILD